MTPPVVFFFIASVLVNPVLDPAIFLDAVSKRTIFSNTAVAVIFSEAVSEESSRQCIGTAKLIPLLF